MIAVVFQPIVIFVFTLPTSSPLSNTLQYLVSGEAVIGREGVAINNLILLNTCAGSFTPVDLASAPSRKGS